MSEELHMALPLDDDGFLRRECPTCEQEFKWLPTQEGNQGEPEPDGGYYCPYCAVQAPAGSFFTKAQVELAQNLVAREVVGPEIEKWGQDLRRSRRPNDLISIDVRAQLPPPADPLVEQGDMRRIDFACHPTEPLKVLDAWTGSVHCLVCGIAVGGVR